jgi:FAT domain
VELAALVGESYSRAYSDIVRAQQCTELMEVVEYMRAKQVVARLQAKPPGGSDSDSADDEARKATERMQLVRVLSECVHRL